MGQKNYKINLNIISIEKCLGVFFSVYSCGIAEKPLESSKADTAFVLYLKLELYFSSKLKML